VDLFAVFKTNIYRHGCGGIFATREMAEVAARTLIAGECDDRHDYEIVPFCADSRTDQTGVIGTGFNGGGQLIERMPLLTLHRSGGEIEIVANRTEQAW